MKTFFLLANSVCLLSFLSGYASPIPSPPSFSSDYDDDDFDQEIVFVEDNLKHSDSHRIYLADAESRQGTLPQRYKVMPFASCAQLGVNYTRVHFSPHGHTSFDGNLGGLQGQYEYRANSHFYAGVKLAWKQGESHGERGKRSLVYGDVQERLGYWTTFDQGNQQLTVFSGFAYRYLGQDFDPKVGSSVSFHYSEFYVPVGGIIDFSMNSWFAFSIGFTWMPQVFPTVLILPLQGAHWSLSKSLANFSVELPLDFTLTDNKRCHLILNPFYEYWQDGHSTAKTAAGVSLGLPGNTYSFWGANLNFAYEF